MNGAEDWILTLAQSDAADIALWETEQAETPARPGLTQADARGTGGLRLTDAELDRLAWALCRRLLDAAGNM